MLKILSHCLELMLASMAISKQQCLYSALLCTLFSCILLAFTLFSSHWTSACLPLVSVFFETEVEQTTFSFDPELPSDLKLRNILQHPGLPSVKEQENEEYVGGEQIGHEKALLYQQLQDRQVCISQGFYKSCIFGNGFFEIGDYELCISTNGRQSVGTEKVTTFFIAFSTISCLFIFLFLFIAARRQSVLFKVTNIGAIGCFLTGTVVTWGLISVTTKTLIYNFNKTDFYNDMVYRFVNVYSYSVKVDWNIEDRDVSEVQACARHIVKNMSDVRLGRDFFLAEIAGVLLYFSCCFLLMMPKVKH